MITHLDEWNALKGSSTADLLLELISDNQEVQRKAWEALDYTLLNVGADRPENYGDPKLLLQSDVLIHVVPVLARIVEMDTFNWLSKYFALGLLWDIHNFVSADSAKQCQPEKTERIRKLVASYAPTYQKQVNHEIDEVRARVQRLLKRIE
ncbi:MAG: hypothetical protein K8J31_06495 [Anaerolineae bacterium]|nr:hypothetical protein [Anaerolineae bacterium]